MELPNNFNQYKPIIEFWRAQGVDCLKSDQEKIEFVYRIIHGYLQDQTVGNMLIFYRRYEGHVSGIINIDSLSEDALTSLAQASDKQIMKYLSRSYPCKPLRIKSSLEDNIKITNSFNEAEIIIPKLLYRYYCRYSDLLDENLNEIRIPIFFDDAGAKFFVECFNNREIPTPKVNKVSEFNQVVKLMDFLCVHIKF